MSVPIRIPVGGVPEDFVATLGGADGLIPAPWRASYVISVSMTGGVRLMYTIDHAAQLPWCWRIPARVERRRALARLVIDSGILRSPTTMPESAARRDDAWLCASAGHLRRVLPLGVVVGGDEITEAFGALVPASVWATIIQRRGEFLATRPGPNGSGHGGSGRGGSGHGGSGHGALRGRLDGEGR